MTLKVAYSYAERYKNDPVFREKVKADRKARYYANREAECAASRERHKRDPEQTKLKARERAERRRRDAGVRKRKPAAPRVRKVRVTAAMKVKRNPVPSHVREAWYHAHPNSVLKQKFPTKESLSKGDWTRELEAAFVPGVMGS